MLLHTSKPKQIRTSKRHYFISQVFMRAVVFSTFENKERDDPLWHGMDLAQRINFWLWGWKIGASVFHGIVTLKGLARCFYAKVSPLTFHKVKPPLLTCWDVGDNHQIPKTVTTYCIGSPTDSRCSYKTTFSKKKIM
jgi:hypothetical protein